MTVLNREEAGHVFADRRDAGRQLARLLAPLKSEHPVVLALPRGGVPVGAEVAKALDAPLDVIVVRKLGLPFQPELGFGAIGEGGVSLVDPGLIRTVGLTRRDVERVESKERRELDRRVERYRNGRPPLAIEGRAVIIVDDGLATGATARTAVLIARAHGARRIVVAVPVASVQATEDLKAEADDVLSLLTPARFMAVGLWYRDFGQTTDDEVAALLDQNTRATAAPAPSPGSDIAVTIPIDGVRLEGFLQLPPDPRGIVIFAHGSGSGRRSPRNQSVARSLHDRGLGTLLFDLLTPAEAAVRSNVFDIELLGDRLLAVSTWLRQGELTSLPQGFFGASTGAGAALWAAGAPGCTIRAVVSRGGRPDLAGDRLPDVRCPTLLVVGGADQQVLGLNRAAAADLRCPHELVVVPRATHLFEEPGALEAVGQLAGSWFGKHLPTSTVRA
jgi:putative phosphoribosyl transferase